MPEASPRRCRPMEVVWGGKHADPVTAGGRPLRQATRRDLHEILMTHFRSRQLTAWRWMPPGLLTPFFGERLRVRYQVGAYWKSASAHPRDGNRVEASGSRGYRSQVGHVLADRDAGPQPM